MILKGESIIELDYSVCTLHPTFVRVWGVQDKAKGGIWAKNMGELWNLGTMCFKMYVEVSP